jgi:hypothetical protein
MFSSWLFPSFMWTVAAFAIVLRLGIPRAWNNQVGRFAHLSDAGYYPAVFALLACAMALMAFPDARTVINVIALLVFVGYQSIAILGAKPQPPNSAAERGCGGGGEEYDDQAR